MRIHRLVLNDYRGVDHAEIEFPAEGVTIIEGDNEAGKTSLSEAIDLVLEQRDDSKKRAVRAVKPTGRDVGAEVEIEISSGPYRFRYRKRWHKQPETELELFEPERVQLAGREAHDRVRAILDETLDGSLWEALRLRQGTQLEQASFAGGSLGRALDLAAGGESSGDLEDDLWARITAERERYWTPTGQPKADRAAAAQRVAESRNTVAELEATLAGLEADAEQVERLTVVAAELVDKQLAHELVLDALVTRSEAIGTHRNDVDQARSRLDTARARHDRALEIDKTRADLIARAADAAARVDELTASIESAQPERERAEARLSGAQTAVRHARTAVEEADLAARRADGDRDYRRHQIELAQLSERHLRVVSAIERRTRAEAVLEASRVEDDTLQRIEDAHLELAKADASATSGAATVEYEALADVDVQIDDSTVALRSGTQHQIQVSESTHLVVPGTISMVVRAGTDARALVDRHREAELEYRSLCEAAGVPDVAGARRANDERSAALRELESVATTLEQDLRDLSSEALARKVAHLGARVETFEANRSAEPPVPADLDSAQISAQECARALEERRDELARAEKDLAAATQAVQQVELGDAGVQAQLGPAHEAVQRAEDSLRAARQDLPDAQVAAEVGETRAAATACAEKLVEAEAALAAEDPDSVDELLLNARGVKKRLADELHENEATTRDLRTKLAIKGEEGLAKELDEAKTEEFRLTSEYDRLESRAAAAKLLYDTFGARRAEAHQRYIAPFRERIEQLGRLVFESDFEVELDDDLRIARRTLEGVTLDFAHLSTGAQEQLGMISRLACASIVAGDGGAPVIFDDALGWSDPRRLERMGAVISMAGRSCQIIVLTCTPGRYASVGSASVMQL